jgi:cellulose synthase (UDP-forming)
VVLFWTVYNLAVLGVAMMVCVEIPRAKTVPEIQPERVRIRAQGEDDDVVGWLVRLTTQDAWIRGGPRFAEGTKLTLDISEVGLVEAEVARIRDRGIALALKPDEDARRRILAKLHTRQGRHGTLRLDAGGVVTGFVQRMLRRS